VWGEREESLCILIILFSVCVCNVVRRRRTTKKNANCSEKCSQAANAEE
jgi:hypothetical protein